MARVRGQASVLRALVLLGCCAQLARSEIHIGKIREWGDPEYYTKLAEIDASHGCLQQLKGTELKECSGFDPDIYDYVVRVEDESVTEVVFSLVLDMDQYNLMYTPQLTFWNGIGPETPDPHQYSPLDVIQLKVPLDVTKENTSDSGPYDRKVWVEVGDPNNTASVFQGGNQHRYNLRVLQPPAYKEACQAMNITVWNSSDDVKESTPKFEADSAEHSYHYIFKAKAGRVTIQCPDVEDVVAKIDGEHDVDSPLSTTTKHLDLEGDVRVNLVATCEYSDTHRTGNDIALRFPSQIRSYNLLIERRMGLHTLQDFVHNLTMPAPFGFCEKVPADEMEEDLDLPLYGGDCCTWDDIDCVACREDTKGDCCNWDDIDGIDCIACKEEYCLTHAETTGCDRILTTTTAAPTTTTDECGICGDTYVTKCEAYKSVYKTVHQFCMHCGHAKGCERYNHHAGWGRRLAETTAKYGYRCKVKETRDEDGKPRSKVSLVALMKGSPDAFFEGKMIYEDAPEPKPTKLRVINGIPIEFYVTTKRRFSLNVIAGHERISVPVVVSISALCKSINNLEDFCAKEKLVIKESLVELQVSAEQFMCKGEECGEDDIDKCCAKQASCDAFEDEWCGDGRQKRPDWDIGQCNTNICHRTIDDDITQCCTEYKYTRNGTVQTHLFPGMQVYSRQDSYLKNCNNLNLGTIQGRCDGAGWNISCRHKSDDESLVNKSFCWTPKPGDMLKIGDQRAAICKEEDSDLDPEANVTVVMAPSMKQMDGQGELWTWVFLPGDQVVVPAHRGQHEQAGDLRKITDFRKGEWIMNMVDTNLDKPHLGGSIQTIGEKLNFFAYKKKYLGVVVSGPDSTCGHFVVNLTVGKGFEVGQRVTTKGAKAKIKNGPTDRGMYTVQFLNVNAGPDANGTYNWNLDKGKISYPMPAYEIHPYTDEAKLSMSPLKYKPGEVVNVSGEEGIVVFGQPGNGKYLVNRVSDSHELSVTEAEISLWNHHTSSWKIMRKDSVEVSDVGVMRLGSAWNLPMVLAVVGAVTTITLIVLRRRNLGSLGRNVQRARQKEQDGLLPKEQKEKEQGGWL